MIQYEYIRYSHTFMETKKILIVEDEPMIRRALVDRFSEEKDFVVMSGKDGEEGLVAALREHPDIILLDLVMPIMDGMEMLTGLRKDEWGKGANVMFLSNLADSERVAEATAKGVYEFIIKSNVDINDIVEKVRKAMLGKTSPE